MGTQNKVNMGDSFEDSMIEINKREAFETQTAIIEIYDKLHFRDKYKNDTSIILKADTPQYYSRGYEAHSEPVSDIELSSWRNNFCYIGLTGSKISSNEDIVNSSFQYMSKHDEPVYSIDNGDTNLQVIGKKMKIGLYADNSEEILAIHGVLDETISINVLEDNYQHDKINMFDSIDPSDVERVDVINSLFDVVWPSVVSSLRPLIEKVVDTAIENGIEISPETNNQMNEDSDGFDDDEQNLYGKKFDTEYEMGEFGNDEYGDDDGNGNRVEQPEDSNVNVSSW